MTEEQIINALKQCGRKHNEKNDKYCKECQFKSYLPCVAFLCDRTIDLINRQKAEIERLQKFKYYFDALYGLGLEIANWHHNGMLEPFDNFYDSAIKEMVGEE